MEDNSGCVVRMRKLESYDPGLIPDRVIVLHCWPRHKTLAEPLSHPPPTSRVHTNNSELPGKLMKCSGRRGGGVERPPTFSVQWTGNQSRWEVGIVATCNSSCIVPQKSGVSIDSYGLLKPDLWSPCIFQSALRFSANEGLELEWSDDSSDSDDEIPRDQVSFDFVVIMLFYN